MKEKVEFTILLRKSDISDLLGCNMDLAYKKILTEKVIKELGFSSVKEFKSIRLFTLEQSTIIKNFIKKIKNES